MLPLFIVCARTTSSPCHNSANRIRNAFVYCFYSHYYCYPANLFFPTYLLVWKGEVQQWCGADIPSPPLHHRGPPGEGNPPFVIISLESHFRLRRNGYIWRDGGHGRLAHTRTSKARQDQARQGKAKRGDALKSVSYRWTRTGTQIRKVCWA